MDLIAALAAAAGASGPAGEAMFITAGTYSWTVPEGVTKVSVVAVGGGNGAGSLTGSTGTSRFGTLYAFGSNDRTGGGNQGADGGGTGGTGGTGSTSFHSPGDSLDATGGGGGAGGYSGNGGNGGNGITGTALGSGYAFGRGGGGGGVGIFGEGASGGPTRPGAGGAGAGGAGGVASESVEFGVSSTDGFQGAGGSGGTPITPARSTTAGVYGGGIVGVNYTQNSKGGGGLGWKNNIAVTPGSTVAVKCGQLGAVRIIWGSGRSFPSTKTGQEFSDEIYINNVLQ